MSQQEHLVTEGIRINPSPPPISIESSHHSNVCVPAIGINNTPCSSPHDINTTHQDDQMEVIGKKGKLTSVVWNHFTRKEVNGELRAFCNYCNASLGAKSSNGTSHLHDHFKTCSGRKHQDPHQMLLNAQKKKDGIVTVNNYVFDQEVCRRELATMIVLHEFPLSVTEYDGFQRFISALQPLFKSISRSTVTRDIFKIYDHACVKTMKLLATVKDRIPIRTDMWTSTNQKRGFMAITAHFIDDSWELQSRIIRFIYIPSPHTTHVLAECLLETFFEWNIDRKLSTVTVDNCCTKDAIISKLLEKLDVGSLLLGGSLFHMRCCAHILNLIVKDGLEVINSCIERIRESVVFWTTSQKRVEKFEENVRQLNVSCNQKLMLDCLTRWNSTYLMLEVAIKYKDVFARLRIREPQYKIFISDDEWGIAKLILEKLKLFYQVSELFSGTKYPTANLYFPYVSQIHLHLLKWINDSNYVISDMAQRMMEKFTKYWDVINGILGVAIVLDPRYKIKFLQFNFRLIYGDERAEKEVDRIRNYCYELLQEYKTRNNDNIFLIRGNHASSDTFEGSFGGDAIGDMDMFRDYDLFVKMSTNVVDVKSEFDHYLDGGILPRTTTFDILSWWRINGVKFPTLQCIAKDVLAISVSTVASESSFSTSGRWVSPHRSRLHPKTLEALMCAQNWMWAEIKGESLPMHHSVPPCIDDEEEDVDDVSTSLTINEDAGTSTSTK